MINVDMVEKRIVFGLLITTQKNQEIKPFFYNLLTTNWSDFSLKLLFINNFA